MVHGLKLWSSGFCYCEVAELLRGGVLGLHVMSSEEIVRLRVLPSFLFFLAIMMSGLFCRILPDVAIGLPQPEPKDQSSRICPTSWSVIQNKMITSGFHCSNVKLTIT